MQISRQRCRIEFFICPLICFDLHGVFEIVLSGKRTVMLLVSWVEIFKDKFVSISCYSELDSLSTTRNSHVMALISSSSDRSLHSESETYKILKCILASVFRNFYTFKNIVLIYFFTKKEVSFKCSLCSDRKKNLKETYVSRHCTL